MSDISEWLDELKLGEYAEAFRAEKITLRALPDVTEADLKEMGLPIGPRRLVLREISALSADTDATPSTKTDAPDQPDQPSRPLEAERRQITVMFCDLVGSTALSEQLDPEDLRALMQNYQQVAGGVIERYEGHVAQYLGDGLMTYFGWPQAHEDDAERAVRAALEIIAAVKTIEAPSPLDVRIGIATGPVVVGETGAGDASVPKIAVGETPNLAARLQSLSGVDEITLGPSTRRLLGGTFELADLGEQTLKGFLEPVSAFRVAGIAATGDRFEAHHQHLTPLVGREAEMAMVMARWEQAKAGEGQVIVLGGEPGIGKSRITQTLRERVDGEQHTRLRYQCSPYHTNSTLHPVIEQLERAAGFAREDTADDKLDKLEQLIPAPPIGAAHALFASLLMLPVERYPTLAMSPQKQKEETLRALADQVAALAALQPVLLIFEDAHWIDPTSQEALDLIVPMVAEHRVLTVITHRPEYDPPWLGQGHVAPLALTRLARADAAAMVARVSDRPLPEEMLEQIVAKTDGVPLFVEELTRTVLESGAETANAIPETLQDSLMARLDRLSPVKEVAQIGSCIGRQFSHELLAAVSSLNDNELGDALQQLVNSELIHRSGSSYVFKHALVQDAAYSSLLNSRRQQHHGHISDALITVFPERAESEPELLGYHSEGAGRYAAAVDYFHQAAEHAMTRSALAEAVAHGEKAVGLVDRIEVTNERDERELKARATLGGIYLVTRGYGHPSIREQLLPARELAHALGDSERLYTILWVLWVTYLARGETGEALENAVDQLSAARSSGDDRKLVQSLNANAITHCALGNFETSHEFAEEMDRTYDFDRHHDIANANNHDPKTGVLNWDVSCLWILGWPNRALKCWSEQVALAKRVAHPYNLAFTYSFPTPALAAMGRYVEAQATQDKARELAREHDMAAIDWLSDLAAGECLIGTANYEEGLRCIEMGVAAFEQFEMRMLRSHYDAQAALALAHLGRLAEAQARVRQACDAAKDRQQGMHLAEVWRIRGVIDEIAGCVDDAEQAFRKAVEIAVEQRAKSWELRSATSLARLWQSQGKSAEARNLLDPIYRWFTEGFDTTDLKDAKALLEDLT